MVQVRRRRRKPTSTRANGHDGERMNPSPSLTPCSGTELMKTSESPPPRVPGWMEPPLPAAAGSWLILDRFVHYSRRRGGVFEGDVTTSSVAEDCAGRTVRVSLRIADPPAVSRLYLHWLGSPHNDLHFSVPTAIAAHRNSILFRMTVPFDDPNWWHDTPSFPIDYFVYSCSSSSSSPSLTLLPPCFDGGDTDPELDKRLRQHRRQRQRIMFNAEMGILCHGDGFTVAHLCHYELELCLLHSLPSAGSVPMEWSLRELVVPPDMKIDLDSWRTDVVVPIGRSLCWVDYYQGLLFVDVLAPADSKNSPNHQLLLHGVRLPAQALKSRRLYNENGDPDPFRHVCVTDAGVIKLVCVFVTRSPDDDDFQIITWTLADINTGSWTKDVNNTIKSADKFFDLYDNAAQSCLPRVQPTFPVMSLVDPDVICFLLKEADCNLTWMVEVNMRTKVLLSSALYIHEEEEHPSEKDCMYNLYDHYFIPTKFSSYLSKDPIKSRKLSEDMQKAKEERAVQKVKEERALQKVKEERAAHKPKKRAMKELKE